MYDTHTVDAIAVALLELTGRLNSPRQDEVLLRAAGVTLDRALFPLLVRLNAAGTLSVGELADLAGRDPSTVSRQLAKLEELGLVVRPAGRHDMRVRAATITKAGARTLKAITEARRRLLGEVIQNWSALEQKVFPELLQRLAGAMKEAAQAHRD
jgi:DNA-binding MarR family transcriptional regulator